MIEEIISNLYRIDIPLTGSPLKALNAYVIKGPERHLIVDTGWNREDCLHAMQQGLKQVGIDLNKTDFFITHLHADHIGLVSRIATSSSKIYFNQPEARSYKAPIERFLEFARMCGFPETELQEAIHRHPGLKYGYIKPLDFTIVKEHDVFSIGEYRFSVVETPGHTPGHLCLYDSDKKVLLAGDHVLWDISPNIQLWSDDRNPLKEYMASLDKVYDYDVELVLPGHRTVFTRCKDRITELKAHHAKRLDEVVAIVEASDRTAFQVASRMGWDITSVYDSWDSFPVPQKWFATGEAVSHLKYLEDGGILHREIKGKKFVYSVK